MKKIFLILSLLVSLFSLAQSTGTNVPFYVGQRSSDPSGAKNGTLYYNTTSNLFRAYVNGSWVDFNGSGSGTSFSAKEIKFQTSVTAHAPVAGDSIFVWTGSSSKKINLFREGELQYDSSSVDGYERSGDTITFHPVLATNERILIQSFDSAGWTYEGFSAPSESCQAITTTNLVESPACTWANASGSGSGVTTLALPGDGYIQMEYLNSTTNNQAIIGLDINNTNNNYTSWKYGVVPISSSYYDIVDGSTPDVVGTPAINDVIRIERTGSTVVIKINGTIVHTFTATTSATLYGKIMHLSAGQQISNVKGLGFE